MTTAHKSSLVNFERPPVVETVLSVQFKKLNDFRSVHLGSFWQSVRDRFPQTEERPALPAVIERQELPPAGHMKLRFETLDILSPQRFWLVNESTGEMMQIQNDRFIKNWRKGEDDEGYPRYEPVIKPGFEKDFAQFSKFVEQEKLGAIIVNQCEVTYVNHIIAGEGWNEWSELDKIFTFWNPPSILGETSDFVVHARFPINSPKGEWIGWLHVDIQPALTLENKPMYTMTLTARGMYGDGYEFFDIGRASICNAFVHLTTENMHKIWGKK